MAAWIAQLALLANNLAACPCLHALARRSSTHFVACGRVKRQKLRLEGKVLRLIDTLQAGACLSPGCLRGLRLILPEMQSLAGRLTLC